MTDQRIPLDADLDAEVHVNSSKARTPGGDYMYSAWGTVRLRSTGEIVAKADVYDESTEEALQSLIEVLRYKAGEWKKSRPK